MAMATEPIRKITLKDGAIRYRCVVDIGRSPSTGKRQQITYTAATMRAAKEWVAKTRVATTNGTLVRRERITVKEYLDQWLAGLNHLKPSTRQNYDDALKVVRDALGRRLLQELTKGDLDSLVTGMLDGSLRRRGTPGQGLSPRAVRLMLTVLAMALEAAKDEGRLQRNVAALVSKPRPAERNDVPLWEPEHVQQFLCAADQHRFGAALRLSLHGLRRGEVVALRWQDVDLDEGEVTISKTHVLIAGRVIEGSPKSKAGRRSVWLGPETVARLRTHRAHQSGEKLQAGGLYADHGFIFADELGEPVKPDAYSNVFEKVSRSAGVPSVTLHQARHGYVSYLQHVGVPTAVVQRLVGHSDPAVTLGVYTHPMETGSRKRVRDALQAVGL